MNERTRVAIAGAVTAAILGVGVYDVIVGGVLLWSAAPWEAHGPGTGWLALAEGVGPAADDATLGLFRRMGAFSMHAGVATIVWGLAGHRHPWLRTLQFATYSVTGLAFGATDAAFFADTPYLLVKRAIGAVFFLAFLAHLWLVLGARRAQARAA